MISRRAFSLLCLAPLSKYAHASESYPTRPVQLVIPFGPGGSTDIFARLLQPELSRLLDGTVVVENRAGANGVIAASAVKRASPDGHTLFMATNSPLSAAPYIYVKVPYNPLTDFTPIYGMATLPFILAVNPTTKARTVSELLSLAKSTAGGLNIGTGATVSLVSSETMRVMSGANIVTVPYKSTPQAVQDAVGGQIQAVIVDAAGGTAHFNSGRLIPLAVTTKQRSRIFANIPAIAETKGLEQLDVTSWYGCVGPAKMRPEVVSKVANAFAKTLAIPEINKRVAELGFDIETRTTSEFTAYVREQLEHWQELVKKAGIKPEGVS